MFIAKIGYIKMSVGVIAYSQLMLVCQVYISSLFLSCHGENQMEFCICCLEDIRISTKISI
jgi:hypothetical protein